jgi:hypothetical protein
MFVLLKEYRWKIQFAQKQLGKPLDPSARFSSKKRVSKDGQHGNNDPRNDQKPLFGIR